MVTFNFTYDLGVTVQQALGFEMAGRIWSSYLSDAVTLNIHVGVTNQLPANVIGGALPGILANTNYAAFRDRFLQDATSNDDRTAGLGAAYTPRFDFYTGNVNSETLSGSTTLNVTRASGKAFGLLSGNSAGLDGAIVMGSLSSSQFGWNYDYTRSSAPGTNHLDFLSVALHEIGHILGFVSGVDKSGMIVQSLNGTETQASLTMHFRERASYGTPLDLFRVDTNRLLDLTYGSLGGAKGFAVQSNTAMVAEFSTGKNTTFTGDGYQASHWKEQATALGIMDPAVAPRERVSITNLDLRAFDVIGWNLRNGLSASPLTTTSLTNFRNQAVQSLAQRLGQTTTWVNSNLTASPANMVRDRTAEVEAMIQASNVYEWGTTGSGTTSNSGRRWMEIYNQMASNQQVYINFSTVSKVAPVTQKSDVSSSIDPILGTESATPLVEPGLSDFSEVSVPFTPSSAIPSIDVRPLVDVDWIPVASLIEALTPASEGALAANSRKSKQPSGLSNHLNALLGAENNPLAQGSLSAELLEAIA